MIGVFSTCNIVGRLAGSTVNNSLTNFFNYFENIGGNGLYYPLVILNANPARLLD